MPQYAIRVIDCKHAHKKHTLVHVTCVPHVCYTHVALDLSLTCTVCTYILNYILRLGTGLLCLFFYLLCYATVLIKFTYYAQNYAQEEELCSVYHHYLYTNLHD